MSPWVELAKKVPTIVAIVALYFLRVETIRAHGDTSLAVLTTVAIAGLGGFYLHDWIRRNGDTQRGGDARDR